MRLRKIKGAANIVNSSQYVIKEPSNKKGNYNKIFNNDNPIHVEIGMGKGQFIIKMALKYPEINFIGIEKYDSVLVRAIEKLENMYITNLKFINDDALIIESFFEKEVDLIYLNFSDPWPKNRHEGRRLSSLPFLSRYDNIFKSSKCIEMKTDNRKLFEYSLQSFINYEYKIEEISLDLHDDENDNITTEYEDKFTSLGFPIYMVRVKK